MWKINQQLGRHEATQIQPPWRKPTLMHSMCNENFEYTELVRSQESITLIIISMCQKCGNKSPNRSAWSNTWSTTLKETNKAFLKGNNIYRHRNTLRAFFRVYLGRVINVENKSTRNSKCSNTCSTTQEKPIFSDQCGLWKRNFGYKELEGSQESITLIVISMSQ